MFRTKLILLLAATLLGILPASLHAAPTDAEISGLVQVYSTQQVISLNPSESYTFKLRNGKQRVVKLVSVREHRDSVVNLMRRAEVRVEIDGKPLDLICEPYTMPTTAAGMRILADSTSGWGNVPKQVQLSLWDVADPIVNTSRFGFPLRDFRFLSQGTQGYNEPVHLGAGDEDPDGLKLYHDYGFDMAGYEGGEEVVCATAGKVVMFWPSREDPCSVIVQDTGGFHWEYAHLKSLEPTVVLGKRLEKGERIGLLGRTGPSGNFSHIHLGSYLTRQDVDKDNRNTRLNLYPWYVAAYQVERPVGLLAVARPHHVALTGERIVLDGSKSLAWGGGKIVEWRWVLPDGSKVEKPVAQTALDKPGTYVAELWIKDSRGWWDVDFCQIKVYSKSDPEKHMPHIFMTCHPTNSVLPNEPVRFRLWPQGSGCGSIQIDFGDGKMLTDWQPYAEIEHSFAKTGIHVISASCQKDGIPIRAKLKVVVRGRTAKL